MKIKVFHVSILFSLYFIVNAGFLLYHDKALEAFGSLVLAIALPVSVISSQLSAGAVALVGAIGVISAFSQSFEKLEDPDYQYMKYIQGVIGNGEYYKHQERIINACALQYNLDQLDLVFKIAKAYYGDLLFSIADVILSNHLTPLPNHCLIAVDALISDHPELNRRFIE
ncbi:hypothetical protein [Aliivibrio sifiae]|uniref:hypothetical protein n=1 Tax=Aliivibrio sifiae TaxID=566293 RepID=UPI003D11B690